MYLYLNCCGSRESRKISGVVAVFRNIGRQNNNRRGIAALEFLIHSSQAISIFIDFPALRNTLHLLLSLVISVLGYTTNNKARLS